MIKHYGKLWILDTAHTTYAFQVLPTGHIEHLYYGARISLEHEWDADILSERKAFPSGNSISYDQEHPELVLEDLRGEVSSYGKGDLRIPFIEAVLPDGSRTLDFRFSKGKICSGKQALSALPSSYEENEQDVSELILTLTDSENALQLELHYGVFEKRDVITRNAVLFNTGSQPVELKRLMSTQLDLDDSEWIFTTFNGAWAREMNRHDHPLTAGTYENSSVTGASSNRANPFVMLSRKETTQDHGEVYGFNLIYSGNHLEAGCVNAYQKTRFVSGINPTGFSWNLKPGESFETPEAVMTYSEQGFNGMSQQMHDFVRNCIVRGYWKHRSRPVLLNSWEANYFKISEKKLLRLAEEGKKLGIELFVMDDGWFGNRNDDTSSLGDWKENDKKLPGGLSGITKKINALGLDFGIWVEPEMINTDSDLYRAHPEWVMEIPGKPHSEGRNQRILDFSNPEVVDYMIQEMTQVFSKAPISYVKWDMNRIFSDTYSQYLPPERQGECAHRYILGLYRMMKELTERFPEILFEGCASGGNRFDLGILCYFPQIWASDNTDALTRSHIQEGYSYGYPLSVIGAHVSGCPNHQTLRSTPLASRFAVAAFGILGYECNLCDLSDSDKKEIAEQIRLYKEWRDTFQMGRFYRGRTGNLHEWTVVSEDQANAVGMIFQELVRPNTTAGKYYPKGLLSDSEYRLKNLERRHDIVKFGDLVNTVSPIHIRQDSLLHHTAAKFVTMPGEKEDFTGRGSLFMKAGIQLSPAFAGTGYNEKVRYFQDFESRLYFMKKL